MLDRNDKSAEEKPSLSILGVYSFSANKATYARFIRELIDSHDPPNFSEEVKDILRLGGRGDEMVPLAPEERQDLESELRFYMDDAAVLEVLVKSPDSQFNPHDFAQIVRCTSIAWEASKDGPQAPAAHPSRRARARTSG